MACRAAWQEERATAAATPTRAANSRAKLVKSDRGCYSICRVRKREPGRYSALVLTWSAPLLWQGEGFSSPNGPGNIVMVGDQPCVVIPLHSTVAQIACKTTAPIPANGVEIATLTEDGRGHPGGWTERLAVRVWTGGVEAACASVDHWTCTFDMHDHQYHTPRIDSLSPRDVRPGTLLSVAGLFHWTPFSFDQIKAPSMEVPLSSVKVHSSHPHSANSLLFPSRFSRPSQRPRTTPHAPPLRGSGVPQGCICDVTVDLMPQP
ncbi:hypothetical protein T484DRAFT_2770644 [Baffinella frigidus]|nr:hypothetical protein T484DRAFT_2770644 [Cryptophyta sp. CCMP2293]